MTTADPTPIPDLLALCAEAEALAAKAVPGPWTVNDNALAPVHWPMDAHHLSDVAIAFRNTDADDELYESQIASLVFCAFARVALPALAAGLRHAIEEVSWRDEVLAAIVARLQALGCVHHAPGEAAASHMPPMCYDDWISCVVARVAAERDSARAAVEALTSELVRLRDVVVANEDVESIDRVLAENAR